MLIHKLAKKIKGVDKKMVYFVFGVAVGVGICVLADGIEESRSYA